uniref:putative phage abortive infection protein n=1 Tax=Aliarcobacter sp. TaxID=2321116 RepID=UPI004048AD9A
MASKEKNSSKLNFLNWILVIAIGLFLGLLVIYYLKIFDLDTTKKADWGTFGDFFGGTLNPIFALFSLFAIIYTIKIQTKELEFSREELEATRKELEGSRIAQQEQSKSLKLQNEATKLQIFENTFFQLNNIFSNTRLNLNYVIQRPFKEDIVFSSTEVISFFLKELKRFDSYDSLNVNYEKYSGIYTGQIYQIIKFIDDSYIENKQRYVNIFRAQFTKDELEFLFYHCLGIIGKRRFKKLVEDYEFFEHIILNENMEKQLLEYDINAFGKNENILKRYDELKEKAKTEEIPAFVKAE